MTVEIGKLAPAFTLPSDQDEKISLEDFRGQFVILYFYPKDDTPGCTQEACDFSNRIDRFSDVEATVIGISKDSVESHQKFKEKYELPFTLLSDIDGKVCEKYGAWVEKTNDGKKYMGIERTTVLIDKQGIVRHLWRKVKVDGHIKEIFQELMNGLH